ncbi:MAG TPA: TonB-dependent receptor [Vicinamibacterales bacterium]
MLRVLKILKVLAPAMMFVLPVLSPGVAAAQSPNTGSIVVVVVDQSGGRVKDAKVTVTNTATGAVREAMSNAEGSATMPTLSLTGRYKVEVAKDGFTAEDVPGLTLRAGVTATVKVKLVVSGGKSDVTVYGTTEGVRADAQIGKRIDAAAIDETPILGRKLTTLPLFSSAFRQGKGTGDLFVNATYFVTGAGSRRTVTYMLDGANNDEGWGRQTMLANVPVGAVQEVTVLSNAFSAEYGFTAGPALNIVTKSGTNQLRGEGLYMGRPGGWQATSFSTKNFCPPSISTCTVPDALTSILPVDIPDKLNQYSGSAGGAIKKDKTFFFAAADYTQQDRTVALSSTLPPFVLDNGSLTYVGQYRSGLVDARVDEKVTTNQTLSFRGNYDHFYDTNPNDAVVGTTAPSAARRYTRGGWTFQTNLVSVVNSHMLNEARVGYTDGDPVTKWESIESTTVYQRTAGSVPFKIGANQFTDVYSRQAQFSDTLSWSHGTHDFRFGGNLARHLSGGVGTEPGQALGGTFTFVGTGASSTLPFDQLTINDVQNYSQPYSLGQPAAYTLNQWLGVAFAQDKYRVTSDLTLDLGLRYDVQTLTDSRANFEPRVGFGWHPGGDPRLSIRGGYGSYYTQIQSNLIAGYLQSGLDGFTTYTATPGQVGFPTCLTCVPIVFEGNATTLPARNITIIAGRRDYYTAQFPQYGLDFTKVPNYPDELRNPHSQVVSFGAEREIMHGLFAGADYVHQHWSDLVRTVDLNAPSVFDRTAPGQVRTAAQADLTRPIVPVTGGVRNINTIMNLGEADYDGLQTDISYRGSTRWYAALSYTLSKATNTTEPDGNGIGPNDANIAQLGEQERGLSLLDQRHRAVISFTYNLPYNISAGTVAQVASARPVNSTTGVDNNGDGATNDRPVINGAVIGKSAFTGTGTQDVAVFVEDRIKMGGRTLMLRLEGFNLFNHANMLGRGNTTYGDTGAASNTFGQFATLSGSTAIPAFANIDPPRMFQIQIRYLF